jgi:hypothetical protein
VVKGGQFAVEYQPQGGTTVVKGGPSPHLNLLKDKTIKQIQTQMNTRI